MCNLLATIDLVEVLWMEHDLMFAWYYWLLNWEHISSHSLIHCVIVYNVHGVITSLWPSVWTLHRKILKYKINSVESSYVPGGPRYVRCLKTCFLSIKKFSFSHIGMISIKQHEHSVFFFSIYIIFVYLLRNKCNVINRSFFLTKNFA